MATPHARFNPPANKPPPIKLRGILTTAFFMALLAGASAEPHKNYPNVDDTSSVETNGDRVIRLSVEVSASPEAVWQTLSTADGWKSIAVAFAELELKVGGIIETSYNPNSKRGDPDNIKNEIVAYIPGRMLAIRCVQTPRNFKYQQEFFATCTVFEISPSGSHSSRLGLTAVGYRPGEAYDDLFKKFRWGDAHTLDKLRALFDPKTNSPSGQDPSNLPAAAPKKTVNKP